MSGKAQLAMARLGVAWLGLVSSAPAVASDTSSLGAAFAFAYALLGFHALLFLGLPPLAVWLAFVLIVREHDRLPENQVWKQTR